MPIPRDQFERGLDDADMAIVRFLERNKDKAYTAQEIASAVGYRIDIGDSIKQKLAEIELRIRLFSLGREGYIMSRQTGIELYYAWRERA